MLKIKKWRGGRRSRWQAHVVFILEVLEEVEGPIFFLEEEQGKATEVYRYQFDMRSETGAEKTKCIGLRFALFPDLIFHVLCISTCSWRFGGCNMIERVTDVRLVRGRAQGGDETSPWATPPQKRTSCSANADLRDIAWSRRPGELHCGQHHRDAHDRTEMRKKAEELRCTLLNWSAWSTEKKHMRRYKGKCDIFFWDRAPIEEG